MPASLACANKQLTSTMPSLVVQLMLVSTIALTLLLQQETLSNKEELTVRA